MNTRRIHHGVRIGMAIIAALTTLGADTALGQRTGRSLSSPGSLGNTNFGSSSFRSNSYGLGGLSRGGGSGGGVLSTSVSGVGSYSLRAGGSTGGTGGIGSRMTVGGGASRVLYRPKTVTINSGMGGSSSDAFQELADNRVILGQHLLGVLGLSDTTLTVEKRITSLAPDNRGQFATLMRAGEASLKIRQYSKAVEEFGRANVISTQSPETLLSLANAHFGRGSYAVMSHYLGLTIKYFPELPLADLQLRRFFRSNEDFIVLRTELIEKTRAWPNDAHLWLCLAYVHWFDGDAETAADALRKGIAVSRNPEVTEAIEQFWEGCVASGKVSEPLVVARPTSRPARKNRSLAARTPGERATTDPTDSGVPTDSASHTWPDRNIRSLTPAAERRPTR